MVLFHANNLAHACSADSTAIRAERPQEEYNTRYNYLVCLPASRLMNNQEHP
jgi:hypothetical protein